MQQPFVLEKLVCKQALKLCGHSCSFLFMATSDVAFKIDPLSLLAVFICTSQYKHGTYLYRNKYSSCQLCVRVFLFDIRCLLFVLEKVGIPAYL